VVHTANVLLMCHVHQPDARHALVESSQMTTCYLCLMLLLQCSDSSLSSSSSVCCLLLQHIAALLLLLNKTLFGLCCKLVVWYSMDFLAVTCYQLLGTCGWVSSNLWTEGIVQELSQDGFNDSLQSAHQSELSICVIVHLTVLQQTCVGTC